MRLKNRRIIITGAGSGFGRATAGLFAREGAALALFDQDEKAVAETAAMFGGHAYQVDVTDEDQVNRVVSSAVEALGGLDGVVNSAGIMSSASFEDTDPASWRRVIEVNLTGTYLVCRAALPALRQAEHATIVNIASGQALLPSLTGCSYAASKAGVMMFTKSLAVELAPSIRANVICPGASDTPMTQKVLPPSEVAKRAALAQSYALKRLTEPEEVANAILFLTSSEASAITGIAMSVDCGRTFH
ncbi:SDR family NAD(P)-dependent oxidoreductase [Microvirga antarctica]|uniref:SDR family NAD(P)-dependent oxidoreductase n=1 Tax=Microvirga antarctica TaxID=2819233 RepID=UPI001FE53382|nr:SDR family NAD(P)-dependent oxidoreductase [Microvirga antarctica]